MFAYFLERLRKTSEASRWETPLIETPKGSLTKEDVYRYYMHPKVRRELLRQFGDRPVTVVHKYEEAHPTLKRHRPDTGKFIRISHAKPDPEDPSGYLYWVTRRAVEFHPTFGKEVDAYWVDLDPRSGFPFQKTKEVAKAVGETLSSRPEVKGVEFVYSGGRGIYVKAPLRKGMAVDRARENLRKALGPLATDDVTFGLPASDRSLRLDVGTLKRLGSLRAAWSLNTNTGRVAVPIRDLDRFDPERDATIERALGGKPPPAKVYRP